MPSFRENHYSPRGNVGVGVDIVSDCNLNCVQCFYRGQKNSPCATRMITLEQMKLIIEKTKEDFLELYLLGGEPTLHPQLQQILYLALNSIKLVVLVTNGLRLAEEDYCKKIAMPGISLTMRKEAVSSKAKDLVDCLSGRYGTFELSQMAWKNVEKHWRGKIYVQLNLVRPLLEEGHVMEVFKWARSKGYEPLIELTKASSVFERGNELDVPIGKIQKLFEEMRAFDEKHYPDILLNPLVPPYYNNRCTLMETSIHIIVDGTVIPCVGNQTPPYGNIFTDDVKTLSTSPLREAIRDYKNWIVGPCRNCAHFDYCHGGCRGEARWETGCLRASNPYCWYHHANLTVKDMVPKSCKGCLLENYPTCQIKV